MRSDMTKEKQRLLIKSRHDSVLYFHYVSIHFKKSQDFMP